MFKKENKHYLVTLITKDKEESMQVTAKNKKDAEEMVSNVLMKCSLFGFKSRDEFILKCKRIYKED